MELEAGGETYLELLVIAGSLLACRLELVAHVADLLVDFGVLCGRHFGFFLVEKKRTGVGVVVRCV